MSQPQADTNQAPPLQLLQPGDLVDGRYRVESYLGGGGMASVYRATHIVLEQPVALKVVSPQIRAVPGVAARFIREARAATSLKGAHVARVYDVGTMADGAPYMVMEYLDGKDLGEVLEVGQVPAIEDAVDWVMQACEALAEVHGRGIVHRDLKPANLFLTRGPDGLPCVKLIDFGISRVDSPLSPKDAHGLTQPEAIMGSPRYMAPEMMESAANAGVRSDIWGIGAVLYELLAHDAPYNGESFMDIYIAAKKGPPPAPSTRRHGVPRGLDEVVLKCLRDNPNERYPNVAELAAALVPFAHEDAAERADAIARVLGASRARTSGTVPQHEDVPLGSSEGSRVRRRVSREIEEAPTPEAVPTTSGGRTLRVGLMLCAAVALVVAGALGRARVGKQESAITVAAPPATAPPAPEPPPAAAEVEVQAAPAEPQEQQGAIAPVTPAEASEPNEPNEPTASTAAAPTARPHVDARRRRAPRHAPAPPRAIEAAPSPSPSPSPSTLPSPEPPSPSPAAPAPSPPPDNGTLFEDRK